MSSDLETEPLNINTSSITQMLKSSADTNMLKPYMAKSRWISQSIHPYMDLTRAFYAGVPEAQDDESDDSEHTEEEAKVFQAIMKLQRGFKAVVDACATDPSAFLALITKVSEASNASRGDDSAKLKSRICHFIFEDEHIGSPFPKEIAQVPLLPDDHKSIRGWRHIDTASLLCPLRLRDDFMKDPFDFMDKVLDGSIEITADDLPSFLYETGTIYNEDKEYKGLFRGFIMPRVFRQIFTGPSSALHPYARVNKSKAKLFGLKTVTPRTIAYTAVQTYISLSSMAQWGTTDGIFDLEIFYDNIVGMLETDPESPWVTETLDWWNEQVPGLRQKSAGKKKKGGPRDKPKQTRPCPADRIASQLASQRKRQIDHQESEVDLDNENHVDKRSRPGLHENDDRIASQRNDKRHENRKHQREEVEQRELEEQQALEEERERISQQIEQREDERLDHERRKREETNRREREKERLENMKRKPELSAAPRRTLTVDDADSELTSEDDEDQVQIEDPPKKRRRTAPSPNKAPSKVQVASKPKPPPKSKPKPAAKRNTKV